MRILFLIPLLLIVPLSSFATPVYTPYIFSPQYPSKSLIDNGFNTLLYVYTSRGDLQTSFPEVKQGYYVNLINWALGETSNDSSYSTLHPFSSIWSFLISNKQYIPNQGYQYPSSIKFPGMSFSTGHENQWFFSQGQGSQFRCHSYSGLGNYTIDSIEGMISYAKTDQPKNNFDQSMTHIALSRNSYQSSNGTYSDNPCIENGNTLINSWYPFITLDTDKIIIGSFNLKLGQGVNSTDVYFSVHPNIVVPPHYYLVFYTDQGSINPGNLTTSQDDLEPQLIVNVH